MASEEVAILPFRAQLSLVFHLAGGWGSSDIAETKTVQETRGDLPVSSKVLTLSNRCLLGVARERPKNTGTIT